MNYFPVHTGSGYLVIGTGAGTLAAPSVPTGLTATAGSSTDIALSLTPGAGGGTVASYIFEQSTTGTTPWSQIANPNAPTTTYDNTGLTASTEYWYRAKARNATGDSAYTSVANATTQSGALAMPSVPTGLTATVVSANEIDLSWTAGAGGGAVASYVVQRSPDGSTWTTIGSPSGTTQTSTGLTGSTLYHYQVAAQNATGTSSYGTATTATTQASGSYTPQVLPAQVAAAIAKATANTTQWQTFVSRYGAFLTTMIDPTFGGGYAADPVALPTANLALLYRCYLATGNTSAAYDCADRAIGLMLAAINSYLSSYPVHLSNFQQFLAFGDGTTKTFTLPISNPVSATLSVTSCPLTTTAVVRGETAATVATLDDVDNGYYGYKYTSGMVVNITNSAGDNWLTPSTYAWGTDVEWWQHYDDPQFKSVGDYAKLCLDWGSLSSSNVPSHGSTYYFRHYDLGTNTLSGYSITSTGSTVTLATAPAAGAGIFFSCLYGTRAGDFSTLSHQTTICNDGGFWSIEADGTYITRYLYSLAVAYDWLYDYPGFTNTLKTQIADQLIQWCTFIKTNGYERGSIFSNYSAGGILLMSAVAAALNGRTSDGTTLATWMETFYNAQIAPLLGSTPFQTHPDPNTVGDAYGTGFYADTYTTFGYQSGGWEPEGWGYGGITLLYLMLGCNILESAGIVTTTAAHAAATAYLKFGLHSRVTVSQMPVYGDDGIGPKPYPSYLPTNQRSAEQGLYVFLGMNEDAPTAAMTNYMIQNGSFDFTWMYNTEFCDLMWRNPTATATDPATLLPLAYRAGVILSRADWTYTTTCCLLHAQPPLPSDHQQQSPGHTEIWRGAVQLLANPDTYGISFGRSQYLNLLTISDNGAGLSGYGPWQMWVKLGNVEIQTLYDETSAYTYAEIDTLTAWSNDTTSICTESTQVWFHVRPDYVICLDRNATTTGHHYPKRRQSTTINAVTITGNSWVTTNGAASLFCSHYSPVALTTTSAVMSVNSQSYYQTLCVPTTNLDRFILVSVFQSAPSTTTTPDATAFITSSDNQLFGVLVGLVVVMAAQASHTTVTAPTSYTVTAPSGTTTHYVADLTASHLYTLTGCYQGTATASTGGVLTFTTTGSGSKTVTIS